MIRKIKYWFHAMMINSKRDKLECMLLNIVRQIDRDVLLLIDEGMWYSDVDVMLRELEERGYIDRKEGQELQLTEKALVRLNGYFQTIDDKQ